MADIRFVIFDMDGVLYDYDHAFRLRELEKLTGRAAAEIDRDVFEGGHEERAEAGDPSTAEGYLMQYARLLRHPIDAATWTDIRRRMNTPRPGVLAMATALKAKADLALLTNNGMMLKQAMPVCAPEMIGIFGERAHVSAEFGQRKPAPDIFAQLCARYGHAPAATAFIDDRIENIEGAAAAGLAGHHYQTEAGLRAFLQDLGLLS